VFATRAAAVRGVFLAVAVLVLTGSVRADLQDYVKRPEADFAWKLHDKKQTPQGTVYDLQLTSQNWQGIVWKHQLQVYQPADVKPQATLFLWNTGGNASTGNQLFAMELAKRGRTPVAFLYNVPNQPLLGDKKEDALIAETFVRYLDTKDENWPLLFPMVKSVVKAMDALQEFSKQEWQRPVTHFIVSGGSKRGWTSWLTGATGDPRVKAIAPVVIDTLNMRAQGPHQLASFGKYSDMIRDYTERGLLPMPDTKEALKLWSMVDPWVYRERLTLPKLLINGNNDPYWTTDALNLYWDDLQGDKWVLYVPNAGHNLQQKDKPLLEQAAYAANGLGAYIRHYTYDNPMPKMKWKHDDSDGKLRLTVESSEPIKGARLWVAAAPTRDFRQAKWLEKPAELRGGKVIGLVDPPKEGCLAFFAELDYEMEDLQYHLSTQLRIAGKPAGK
jgi:PhoPQ-activated pathogenicity-related protein